MNRILIASTPDYIFNVIGLILSVIFLYCSLSYGYRVKASSDTIDKLINKLNPNIRRLKLRDVLRSKIAYRIIGGRVAILLPVLLFLSLIVLNALVVMITTI